jgi:NADPH2:quinone reductase
LEPKQKTHERNCMKAVVVENYDSIDGISIKEIDTPGLSKGCVRVKVGAAAVGFVDGLKVQGLYQTKDPLPFVPGTEFAGIVDAVADDVTAFKPAMPVIGMTRSGALAEYISVPSAALKHLPPQVPFEAGASFQANYLTGLYALDARASLREGEILLVLGAAGGVGIAAVQIGKLMGARVIAAASTRRSAPSRCGSAPIRPSTTPGRTGGTRSRRLTGGHGPDVIFDPSAARWRCRRFARLPGAGGIWWSGSPRAPFRRWRSTCRCSRAARCSASTSPRSRSASRRRMPA